jgi:hypothetical protein
MCGVIISAVAAASLTSTSICQYVVCGSRSQVFRFVVKGTCTLFLSFARIKVWSVQKQY